MDYSSYIWCHPYLRMEPEHCFVVDDGHGLAVGYLLGTPNTRSFVETYIQSYIPYLSSLGLHRPGPDEPTGWTENLPNALKVIMHCPEHLLHEDYPELLERCPAHIHIDLLPAYQRQGYGRELIETFCAAVKAKAATGVHLTMAGDNVEAGKFYTRVGFKRFPQVLDGGMSGEEGRDKNGNIWQVRLL